MSIFDAEERRIIEQEREEAELQASIERDKEIDEALDKLKAVDTLLATCEEIKIDVDEEDVKGYTELVKEGLELVKAKYEVVIKGKVDNKPNTEA